MKIDTFKNMALAKKSKSIEVRIKSNGCGGG